MIHASTRLRSLLRSDCAGAAARPDQATAAPGHSPNRAEAPDRQYAGLISEGQIHPLHLVPFHANGPAPLTRRVLAGDGIHPDLGKRVVVHEICDVPASQRSYCEPHVHDCDEINILLSFSQMSFEIRLGDEVYIVEAPASVYIPGGLVHSSNVVQGSGFFIAVIDTPNYAASTLAGSRFAATPRGVL